MIPMIDMDGSIHSRMNDANASILRDAIGRNAPMVLSLPSSGMLRHHKSRFLNEDPEGFWVESVAADATLVDELIHSGESCGISFRSGQTKVVFSAPALRREPVYKVNDELTVEAVLLKRPQGIKTVQRRENYRVHVPLDAQWLSVRIWRIGNKVDLREQPMSAQEINTQIRDLSTTGLGVILSGEANQPPKFSTTDRIRIELMREGQIILMEGRICYPTEPPAQPSVRAGIQFAKLQDGIEGRQTQSQLTRIVGELQREEIRRYRLGMTDQAA
jgi:c-di-GMP-binding flagellar brake protein YcgR